MIAIAIDAPKTSQTAHQGISCFTP
ncbi:hypothetical protein ISF9_075 [Microbacterium phage vB_MoxS-ISF9]|uniref:Uncharacterized protein n=1 Tax=Microbacterium phage vB_MoxS-ISF9 TaxID=1458670 RepID=W8NNM4_9CAUD|nr:hypothetical protein ISF9_075 [Microbacterium phage vB_MoxS-ISF9]AHL18545.1 hypothetical protein ISF9_075 [Microbacterium phage vB_MoxS-ISF9]